MVKILEAILWVISMGVTGFSAIILICELIDMNKEYEVDSVYGLEE